MRLVGKRLSWANPVTNTLVAVTILTSVLGGAWYSQQQSVSEVHSRNLFNVRDDRALVGFASDVFLGRVVEQVGTEQLEASGPGDEGLPITQFSVDVIESIKGKQSGRIEVNQMGGYAPIVLGERLHLFDDDPLLRPGETVLFVTKWVPEDGWHQIVSSGYGDIRVRDALHARELVSRFREALARQKSFDEYGRPIGR